MQAGELLLLLAQQEALEIWESESMRQGDLLRWRERLSTAQRLELDRFARLVERHLVDLQLAGAPAGGA